VSTVPDVPAIESFHAVAGFPTVTGACSLFTSSNIGVPSFAGDPCHCLRVATLLWLTYLLLLALALAGASAIVSGCPCLSCDLAVAGPYCYWRLLLLAPLLLLAGPSFVGAHAIAYVATLLLLASLLLRAPALYVASVIIGLPTFALLVSCDLAVKSVLDSWCCSATIHAELQHIPLASKQRLYIALYEFNILWF
jgi:hypothetical protein